MVLVGRPLVCVRESCVLGVVGCTPGGEVSPVAGGTVSVGKGTTPGTADLITGCEGTERTSNHQLVTHTWIEQASQALVFSVGQALVN